MPNRPPDVFRHYESKDAILRLAEELELTNNWRMQDWSIQVRDPERVVEFLNYYENTTDLSENAKFTLINIILASLDEASPGSIDEQLWSRVTSLVLADWQTHAHSIWYWSDWGNSVEESPFQISRYLREIWPFIEAKIQNK
jgi:hypothetical protein